MDKYDRKLFIVKKKKYIIPVVEVVVGALFASLSQAVIEKCIEDLI